MAMKISTLLISLIVIGMITGIFGVAITQMSDSYNNTNWNNTTFEKYNKLTELNRDAEELRNKTTSAEVDSSGFDVLGNYFTQAYISLKMSMSSIDLANSIFNSAIDDADLGYAGSWIRLGVPLIIIIIIVFIIISAIAKREV